MKEINGYTLATVPDGFYGYSIVQLEKETILKISDRVGDYVTVIIPKGNYSIIGLGKDLTEEQWKGIVKAEVFVHEDGHHFDEYFKDYTDVQQIVPSEYNLQTATESGHSLLKANNLNPNNCLILKKIL